jgi:hypothetical protein
MKLSAVTSGRIDLPIFVVLFGIEGIGKSTFAAAAPSPIVLDAEGSTNHLDVPRFPRPTCWGDVLEACDVLATDQHTYRTIVVDTLDAIEPLCWEYTCEKAGKTSIESFGYGKGYTAALDEWRPFLSRLEVLRERRRMNVILLAHHQVKKFQNPEGEDFDRYEMKLNRHPAELLRYMTDATLFASYETATYEKDGKAKGVATGKRLIHTGRTAAFDAKNRYSLPPTLPLEWGAFESAVSAGRALQDETKALMVRLSKIDKDAADAVLAWTNARPRAMHEVAEMKKKLEARLAAASPTQQPTTTSTETNKQGATK